MPIQHKFAAKNWCLDDLTILRKCAPDMAKSCFLDQIVLSSLFFHATLFNFQRNARLKMKHTSDDELLGSFRVLHHPEI